MKIKTLPNLNGINETRILQNLAKMNPFVRTICTITYKKRNSKAYICKEKIKGVNTRNVAEATMVGVGLRREMPEE